MLSLRQEDIYELLRDFGEDVLFCHPDSHSYCYYESVCDVFEKENQKIKTMDKKYVDLMAEMFGVASSGALMYNCQYPEAGLVASVSAPIVSYTAKSIISDIFNDKATERECRRFKISSETASKTFKRNIAKGLPLRNDGLFESSEKDECKFDDVLEAALKSIKDDTESLKSEIYGRFLGNIPFREDLDYVLLLNMRKTLDNLSFTELCMLRLFNENKFIGINKIRQYFFENQNSLVYEVYTGLLKMSANGVLVAKSPFSLGDTIGNLEISKFGKTVCEVAELELIDEEWLNPLRTVMIKICA